MGIKFKVKKPFGWGNPQKTYEVGDIIEITERHPRLNGLILGRYLQYDSGDMPVTPKEDPLTVAMAAAGMPPLQ